MVRKIQRYKSETFEMELQLQQYSFKVRHKKGSENADALYRIQADLCVNLFLSYLCSLFHKCIETYLKREKC